jgi:hypothetical protein
MQIAAAALDQLPVPLASGETILGGRAEGPGSTGGPDPMDTDQAEPAPGVCATSKHYG